MSEVNTNTKANTNSSVTGVATEKSSSSINIKSTNPSGSPAYGMIPTPGTLYWRQNFLWQFWRFVRINFKMVIMIYKSHHTPPPQPPIQNNKS